MEPEVPAVPAPPVQAPPVPAPGAAPDAGPGAGHDPDEATDRSARADRAERAPVMADVAALAGVSHQTVSRVINDHPSVRPDTRERVEAAVRELGYRPNSAARALVTRRTRTIGVISASPAHFGPAQTLLGLEAAARAAGYAVTVAILSADDPAAMRDAVEHLVDQAVGGIVVIAPQDSAEEALRRVDSAVPLVAVEVAPDGGVPDLTISQGEGAGLATRHLLELGHTRIAHLAGPSDWLEARARTAGWRAEMAAAGLEVVEPWVGDWTPASGYEAGRRLANRRDVTAVVVANDQMALGLICALVESGASVPGDVSVTGYDDIPEAGYLNPALTTVRQDFAELGRRCLQVVLARIDGREVVAEPVQPHLVVRSSTAPPGRRRADAPGRSPGA